jgi:hypothetical protein
MKEPSLQRTKSGGPAPVDPARISITICGDGGCGTARRRGARAIPG